MTIFCRLTLDYTEIQFERGFDGSRMRVVMRFQRTANQRGSVLVEMAIVLPVLLLLILGGDRSRSNDDLKVWVELCGWGNRSLYGSKPFVPRPSYFCSTTGDRSRPQWPPQCHLHPSHPMPSAAESTAAGSDLQCYGNRDLRLDAALTIFSSGHVDERGYLRAIGAPPRRLRALPTDLAKKKSDSHVEQHVALGDCL